MTEQPTDREIEIRCAKECGMTIRRPLGVAAGQLSVIILVDRDGKMLKARGFSIDASDEFVLRQLAIDFLSDGSACDLILAEADRRGWDYWEGKCARMLENDPPNHQCQFMLSEPLTLLGDAGSADRRRARCLAFLAACDAVKGEQSNG